MKLTAIARALILWTLYAIAVVIACIVLMCTYAYAEEAPTTKRATTLYCAPDVKDSCERVFRISKDGEKIAVWVNSRILYQQADTRGVSYGGEGDVRVTYYELITTLPATQRAESVGWRDPSRINKYPIPLFSHVVVGKGVPSAIQVYYGGFGAYLIVVTRIYKIERLSNPQQENTSNGIQ